MIEYREMPLREFLRLLLDVPDMTQPETAVLLADWIKTNYRAALVAVLEED